MRRTFRRQKQHYHKVTSINIFTHPCGTSHVTTSAMCFRTSVRKKKKPFPLSCLNSATAGRGVSLTGQWSAANGSALKPPHKCDTAPLLAPLGSARLRSTRATQQPGRQAVRRAVSQGGASSCSNAARSERIGRGSEKKVAIWPRRGSIKEKKRPLLGN